MKFFSVLLLCAWAVLSVLSPTRADAIDRERAYQSALPLYQYDRHQPLAVKSVETKVFPDSRMLRFSYVGGSGVRVPALLFVPKSASKSHPVPCLVLLHPLGGSKEMMAALARFIAPLGYASLVIDEYGQGERAQPSKPHPTLTDLQTGLVTGFPQTVIDVRRGLDYLATRPQIDSHRIGLIGLSLGALIGTVASGVDPRFKATVCVSGGGDWAVILKALSAHRREVGGQSITRWKDADWQMIDAMLAPEDPLTFAAHIAPRAFLMESGRLDKTISPEAAAALYAEASRPANAHAHIDWYAQSGHVPAPELIYPAIRDWLAKNL